MYLIMDTPFEKNEVFVNRLDLSANKIKKGELVLPIVAAIFVAIIVAAYVVKRRANKSKSESESESESVETTEATE